MHTLRLDGDPMQAAFASALLARTKPSRQPVLPDPNEPDMRIARIRLSDKSSHLHPRHVAPKPAQAYEPEVPVNLLLTPAQAARRLGMSEKTLRGHVRTGDIRYVNVGRGKER